MIDQMCLRQKFYHHLLIMKLSLVLEIGQFIKFNIFLILCKLNFISKRFVESESDHTREPSRQQSVEDFDPKRFARPKRNREWRQAPRRSIVPSSSRAADGSLPPVKLLNGSQERIQRYGYDYDEFDEVNEFH